MFLIIPNPLLQSLVYSDPSLNIESQQEAIHFPIFGSISMKMLSVSRLSQDESL